MTLVYILGALFLGWLAWVLYRTRLLVRRRHRPRRLAVLVRNGGDRVEWLVRSRLAAAGGREPGMRVVLVDDGSADETPLIMDRLARRFNMEFRRLMHLGPRCARVEDPKPSRSGNTARDTGTADIHCPGFCIGESFRETEGPGGGGEDCLACCVDLHDASAIDVNLNRTV
ncbi:MAG: hypothetical protein MJA84_07060 [Firmicutes bacterium]|nr:hypothetical protein [Bacillota bacterium]